MTTQDTTENAHPAEVRDAWDAIAPGFDELVTPGNLGHGEDALRRVDIRPGTRLLDVAAGSGALSIPAARRGADVLAVDLAPAMIERLTARARALGLSNVEGRVMDGHALDLADGAFDAAVSQHGVSILPDADRGLAEMVRVTRPGGTVLVVAFGALPKAEFLGFLLGALKAAVPDLAGPPGNPLPFQLADPDVFGGKLTAAGLSGVAVDTVTWDMPFRSGAHLWAAVTSSNPIAARLVAGLSAAQRADVEQVLDGILRERSGGRPGATLHAEVNIGTGTR